MKKIICICLFGIFSIFVFASEVSDLLQAVQTAYESGDVSTAIQKLDSVKSIMEKEQLSLGAESYIEVTNWDAVKLKQSEYENKKVKIKTGYYGPTSNGSIHLLNIGGSCTYDESLVDKLLSIKKYEDYTFYGTVFIKYSTPYLHIEAIE